MLAFVVRLAPTDEPKKLCCDPHDNTPRSRPRQADRNLVPGRGAGQQGTLTRGGPAWLTASRAPRWFTIGLISSVPPVLNAASPPVLLCRRQMQRRCHC